MSIDHDDAAPSEGQTSTGYDVGYGRPPVATRFQPGRSGNPRGRPRGKTGKANFGMRPTDDILLAELHRPVTIRENGRITKVPAITAVIRANIQQAVKGSRLHAKALIDPLRAIEAGHSNVREAAVVQAIEAKKQWQKRIDDHVVRGLPPPAPPTPHPDDIQVDVSNACAKLAGPATDADRAALEEMLRHRDQLIHDYQTAVAVMADFPDTDVAHEIKLTAFAISQMNAVLPERYRRAP